MKALSFVATLRLEKRELLIRFNPFRNHALPEIPPHADDGRDDGSIVARLWIIGNIRHE